MRVPKTFLADRHQCVSCYYPTTPTDYPSTARGRSVGHSVAVNIDICGYLPFLSELYGYSMPLTTFLVMKEFLFHRLVLIFQPSVNSRASDNQSKQCQNHISQLGKMHSYKVSTYISVLVEGCRRWRGTFWLLNENLTFKGPEAYKATAVNRIGVNKISPNFDTLFETYI